MYEVVVYVFYVSVHNNVNKVFAQEVFWENSWKITSSNFPPKAEVAAIMRKDEFKIKMPA